MGSLNTKRVQAIKEPGMYGDGAGLYLRVGPTGSKSWILRTTFGGRRREYGLGSASLVSLKEAREAAHEGLRLARKGVDPASMRKRDHISFEEATRQVHQGLLPTWQNKKHAAQWISSMEAHVFPKLGHRPIDTIGTADVLNVLTPIWTSHYDTARRIKQRIASVIDWAKTADHYPHENPVNGINKALPTVRKKPKHMAALPWQELPGFMAMLSEREGVSARALEFIVLTCARSGEARGARWEEIKGDVWSVPGARMKAKEPHRVPLAPPALAALEAVRGLDADIVFPSASRSKDGGVRPMSDMVFKALMDRMGVDGITTHGFRSTFRVWCGESARVDRELAEAALAHTVGNKVEQAYARTDLFERRCELMERWAQYATGGSADVVRLARA